MKTLIPLRLINNVIDNIPNILVLLLIAAFALSGCEEQRDELPPATKQTLVLEAQTFADLPGWAAEDFQNFAQSFERSCVLHKNRPQDRALKQGLPEAGTHADWSEICMNYDGLSTAQKAQADTLKTFFETYFTPYKAVSKEAGEEGLFTGYYEASLRGSYTKTDRFNVPIYARPDDLVMVNLGDFRDDLKGRRIAGRVIDGRLTVYEDRAEIESGAWPHNDKVLLWVDDPVDAFFTQIQGSGVVYLHEWNEDTKTYSQVGITRIGYAGQNGHPYFAIGRALITNGALTRETVSMQSIRDWLVANPNQAVEIMNTNPSFVFFQENKKGATGGLGTILTPERSLAVDHSKVPYGIPVWLAAEAPHDNAAPIQRLLMAQDTGGAIRGPVRGDVYWGYGPRAEQMAGAMKSTGRYWFLLPRLD